MTADVAPDAGFSIGELSLRTGVPQATLRTWEARYGLPRARRREGGGHRRYGEDAVRAVEALLEHRATGLNMEAAAARVVNGRPEPTPSVFAGLRARHPDIVPQRIRKQTLMSLTRAMEDEYLARAERPVLFAAFQRRRFYRQSEDRWRDLARTASFAAVFADFDEGEVVDDVLHLVPSARTDALAREWVLVCDSPGHVALLAAWESPGQQSVPDGDRSFETIWTVDPQVVRTGARICAERVRATHPEPFVTLEATLGGSPGRASADLARVDGLFHRMIGYLDTARP